MKKRSLCLSLIMILAGLAWVGLLAVNEAEAAKYNWKFAHEDAPDGGFDTYAKEFARILKEKSGGDIKVAIYPAGTLGTSEDLVELTRKKVVHFNLADAGHLGSILPEIQVLLLHYIFPRDINVFMEVLRKGEVAKFIAEKFRKINLEPLAPVTTGWMVWTSNKSLRRPADYKGFKMRTMTSRLLIDNFKAYGANPTSTPYSEVYSGLQLKMIEGQTNPMNTVRDMKFYEVQDYITIAYDSPFAAHMIANYKFYASLPKDIQELVVEAANQASRFLVGWAEREDEKAIGG